MHSPTVSICYIKGENILFFFLLPPIPFHKVQEELTQESEETSLAFLKRRHSLESMCTASPTVRPGCFCSRGMKTALFHLLTLSQEAYFQPP